MLKDLNPPPQVTQQKDITDDATQHFFFFFFFFLSNSRHTSYIRYLDYILSMACHES